MASILSTIQLETTSTSGTLTSEQLATLQESKTNYIVYGTELFKLVDNNTSGDTLIYTCSTNDNGTLKVKSITVTISTLAWTYSELSSGGSAGTKKYQHYIVVKASNLSTAMQVYFSIITTDPDSYDDDFQAVKDALRSIGAIEGTRQITATGMYNGQPVMSASDSISLAGGVSLAFISKESNELVTVQIQKPEIINDLVVEI